MQWVLNAGLLILAFILMVFLGKETVHLANVLFSTGEQASSYLLIEGIVIYFLYFEFIALIVKYFQSGYHFPLRYFVYIGITAIIRLIIVDHKIPLIRCATRLLFCCWLSPCGWQTVTGLSANNLAFA